MPRLNENDPCRSSVGGVVTFMVTVLIGWAVYAWQWGRSEPTAVQTQRAPVLAVGSGAWGGSVGIEVPRDEPPIVLSASADAVGRGYGAVATALRSVESVSKGSESSIDAMLTAQRTAFAQLQLLRGDEQRKRERLESLRADLAKLERQLADLLAAHRVDQGQVARLEGAIAAADVAIRRMERDRQAARRDVVKLKALISGYRDEVQRLRERNEALRVRQRREQEELARLRQRLEGQNAAHRVTIQRLKDELTVLHVDAEVLFPSGSVELAAEGRAVLDAIARLLNRFPNRRVSVVGHTDAVPVGTALKDRYPSNWELSASRAAAAVRYLEEQGGVAPERMMVVGQAQYRPAASNDSRLGRAYNRRIEIRLLPPEEEVPSSRLQLAAGRAS